MIQLIETRFSFQIDGEISPVAQERLNNAKGKEWQVVRVEVYGPIPGACVEVVTTTNPAPQGIHRKIATRLATIAGVEGGGYSKLAKEIGL